MNTLQKISSAILATVMLSLTFVVVYNMHRETPEVQGQYAIPIERLTKDAQKQLHCLAENIYFEARNEPVEGMLAVAFVTMNRVNDSRYPNTICEVVKQKTRIEKIGDRRVVCQFSWWCESTPHHISSNNLLTNSNNKKYNEIMSLSLMFYLNQEKMKDPTQGALFYHADYVSPNWRNLRQVTQIGRHIFYEERDRNGI